MSIAIRFMPISRPSNFSSCHFLLLLLAHYFIEYLSYSLTAFTHFSLSFFFSLSISLSLSFSRFFFSYKFFLSNTLWPKIRHHPWWSVSLALPLFPSHMPSFRSLHMYKERRDCYLPTAFPCLFHPNHSSFWSFREFLNNIVFLMSLPYSSNLLLSSLFPSPTTHFFLSFFRILFAVFFNSLHFLQLRSTSMLPAARSYFENDYTIYSRKRR